MNTLENRLKEIAKQATKLKNKYFQDEVLTPEYIAVIPKNEKEYRELFSNAKKLGALENENESRAIFKLSKGIKIKGENIDVLKIRAHDESENKLGYVSFKTQDSDKLKNQYKDVFITKETANGMQLLELTDKDFDVAIYIPSKNLSEVGKREQELTQEQQLEQEKNKRVQLMADFENYKKRVEQEKSTFGAVANLSLIQDILEVTDDINLAFQDEDLDEERLKEILKLAHDKLIGTVKNSGVEKVEINVGDDFDKEIMEAVTTVPDKKNKGKVVAVISSAYKYISKDGVIKAGKVVVGK